ncbi:DASH complex subunit HSK3 family protein [Aspergillus melleus]|uniref:DASH complex subunit HSK3 family protein n=1 Tax=Aspergillus melleus TaxID=138277 RepID=UPI001E8E9A13|nr:uncharacterized protein LDX57_009234 [Aspergillus melleus]KAH8431573.1 hypothetical protein LDX57_009234 [Aspergillus melleus]
MPPPYNHHTGNPYSARPSSTTHFPATATPSMNMHMNMNMHSGQSYTTSGPGYGSGSGYASSSGGGGSSSMSAAKTRQYAQLHASLAQLNANLADTQNLVRMTAVQAEDMRFLGGYVGALFMGSAKVLGEEGVVKGGDGSGNGGDMDVEGGGVRGVKRES